VREWEQAIRAHSPDSRLFIEDNDVQGEDAVAREARHQAFADFERLGQIDDFRIADIVVNVDGDKALASYRIRGGAHLKGERIPHGGELQFMLWRGRWQIVGHRLVE
jgi:ketosteroid isomerase-like protein